MTTVLVLGGGPDAEREVSLKGAKAVTAAINRGGRFTSQLYIIDRPSLAELRSLRGDVIFPLLHGPYGEGGQLQDLLEQLNRPYIGCRPRAARLCMDKLATKLVAASLAIPTLPAIALNTTDPGCPLEFPVVLKPIHEGSSVGVRFARDAAAWATACASIRDELASHPTRLYMAERAVLGGRELTVGVLDGQALAPIEIVPAVAFYDYQAKYHSDATRYIVAPTLPAGITDTIRRHAAAISSALNVRHLCRVDFMLDAAATPTPTPTPTPWLLEVNTMPGFTDHSLLPMAANHAGLDLPKLCERLADLALRDHA